MVAQLGTVVGHEAQAEGGPVPVPPIVSPPLPGIPDPIQGEFSSPEEPSPPPLGFSGEELSRSIENPAGIGADSTEVVSERTENAKVFLNSDGSHTARVYSAPIHFQDPTGQWREFDTTLVASPEGFRNQAGPVGISFGARADSLKTVTLEGSGYAISFGMEGANGALGKVEGSTVTYPGIEPEVDLQYQLDRTLLKELIVLNQPPEPGPVVFRFNVATGGLTPIQSVDGGIHFLNGEGDPIFIVPAASMWDSSFDEDSGEPAYGPAELTLTNAGGEDSWTIAVSADPSWLASSDRIYPVYVDPTFGFFGAVDQGGGTDAYVTSAAPNSNYNVRWNSTLGYYEDRIGYYDSATGTNWSYLYYNLSSLNGKRIIKGVWNAYFIWSYYATTETLYRIQPAGGGWSASSITWNNKPGLRSNTIDGTAKRYQWRNRDMTSWVRYWTNGTWGNYGVAVHTAGNGTTYWKKIAANENGDNSVSYIDVDYNTKPKAASLVSPGNGSTHHPLTPTLKVSASDPDGDKVYYRFRVATGSNGETGTILQYPSSTTWTDQSSITVPAGLLDWDKTYYWKVYTYDGMDTNVSSVWSFKTNKPPSVPTQDAPVSEFISLTTTPSFSATSTDPEGDNPVKYYFRIATGTDGQTGSLVDSGWITSSTWSPPEGSLVDGAKYYWVVKARDSMNAESKWSSARPLRVDLRLGRRSALPFDELGPLAVNLGTGNLVASTGSPGFSAVGGSLGLAYTYNSQKPRGAGLTGYYFNDDGDHVFEAHEPPTLTRTDPQVLFNWANGSPYPSIEADDFNVRWMGWVTVPVSGSYNFGARSDDGVKIWVSDTQGTPVLSKWSDRGAPATPDWGAPVSLTAGVPAPVKVEYYENGGSASMELWVKGPVGSGAEDGAQVPADWLSVEAPALPGGWMLSADADGKVGYASALIATNSVTLLDSSGASHIYTWTGSTWAPPVGEDGILTNDFESGLLVLHDPDGYIYTFNADGSLNEVTSSLDERKPAALTYTWATNPGAPPRLTKITDPVSGRTIALTYAPSPDCPSAPGFTSPPGHMLCKVDYSEFEAGQTDLYYSNGHLARILDPGGEITDFGYDTGGRLTKIRDPLNSDLIAAGRVPASDDHLTLLAYEGEKLQSVTAPKPSLASTTRPQRTYTYSGDLTDVSIAGAPEPNGYSRQVRLDSSGRAIEERDALGNTTTYEWDFEDRPLKTSAPSGIVNTTVFDHVGRPTDSYGPGSTSEFTGLTSATAPHNITRYDEGFDFLAASWWANPNLAGPPKVHRTSDLQRDWASGSPDTDIPSDGFSGRLLGEINVPAPGAYTFSTDVADEDGVRVFLDEKEVVGRWDTYSRTVLRDSPVAFWRLGETSGTTAYDSSGGSRNGSYLAGVSLGASGAVADVSDKSVSLDGVDDYVSVPHSTSLSLTKFTVSGWVYPRATKSNWQPLITKETNTGGSRNYGLFIRPNSMQLHYSFQASNCSSWVSYNSNATLTMNQWNHVAMVNDGSSFVLYLNGYVDSSQNTTATPCQNSEPVKLGRELSAYTPFNGQLDEIAIFDRALSDFRIAAQYQAGKARLSGTTATLTAGPHRIRVDYKDPSGPAHLKVSWAPSGGTLEPLQASSLKPRLGLATAEIDEGGRTTKTEYLDPILGLATATITDPSGLSLRTETAYEPLGQGYLRRISRTLPKGPSTKVTYSYYGDIETKDNPCTPAADPANQAGALKLATAADPDGAGPQGPIVREYVYDSQGRPVATRVVGDAAWACTSYDSRGRVSSRTDPSGKTQSFDYSDPTKVVVAFTDSSGAPQTTVSETDFLGRAVSYTDEHGAVHRSTYDQAGRLTATYRTFSGQPEALLASYSYDAAGRTTSISDALSGTARTHSFSYDASGRLTATTRANGVATENSYDPNRGWLNSITHKKGTETLTSVSYTRSPSGDITSETRDGVTRSYIYDSAGRLTQASEGSTTRRYAYDLNSNRCGLESTCDGQWLYDSADRLLSSPYASSYNYDSHGNLIAATPLAQPPAGSLDESFSFDAAASTSAQEYPVIVGQSGTLSTTLDWAPTDYATGNPTGSLAIGASASHPITMKGKSGVSASLSWAQGSKPQTSNFSGALPALGTATHEVSPTADGTISATLDWAALPTYEVHDATGSIAASGTYSKQVPAKGESYLDSSLTYTQGTGGWADLTLRLKDPTDVVVASTNVTNGGPATLSYITPAEGGTYTWEIVNDSSSTNVPSFTLANSATTISTQSISGSLSPGATYTKPLTADGRGYIYAPFTWTQGTKAEPLDHHGIATSSTSQNHNIELTKPGTISADLQWTSTQEQINENGTVGFLGPQSYPIAVSGTGVISATITWPSDFPNPDLNLELYDPSGNKVASSSGFFGNSESLSYEVIDLSYPQTATYTLKVVASGFSSSSFTLTGSYPVTADLDLELWSPAGAKVAEAKSTTSKPESLSYSVASGSTGSYTLKVFSKDYPANYSISGSYPVAAYANLTARLKNSSNAVVKSLSGASGSLDLGYLAPAPGGSYTLEISNNSPEVSVPSFTGTASTPKTRYPNLDLELWSPSNQKVAEAASATGRPETLTLTGAPPGSYTLKALSRDYEASYTLASTYLVSSYASLTFSLKDPSGASVATTTSATGSASLSHTTSSGGDYTLEVVNDSSDTEVPSYDLGWALSSTMTLSLKDSEGQVIEEDTSSAKPKTLTQNLTPGRYLISATPTGGEGVANLTASYPGRVAREVIAYDGNDHAISIDDGTTVTEEILNPSGRVIARVVKDSTSAEVSEDLILGYSEDSDSPAYSREASGTLTTYLAGPGGLLLIDTQGAPTYPLSNGHGDIIGTTDSSGAYTANPETDEFGAGEPPANRLGWLGGHRRFATGGNLRLIRMGVRLYDPALGRFLQVDPVEAGSANDYDYCYGDSINCYDLDGSIAFVIPVVVVSVKGLLWVGVFVVGSVAAYEGGKAHGRYLAKRGKLKKDKTWSASSRRVANRAAGKKAATRWSDHLRSKGVKTRVRGPHSRGPVSERRHTHVDVIRNGKWVHTRHYRW